MEIDAVLFMDDGDWAQIVLAERTPDILAKIEVQNGRWKITRLIVDGDLDTATLRGLPYGRIESTLNDPATTGGLSPAALKQWWAQTETPNKKATDSGLRAIDKALRGYFERMAAVIPPARTPVDPEPLGRPDGSDPDTFYRRVAERYSGLTRTTKAPAKVIAEESAVPVTTVHRWIREARTRGFLGPARKGRAG